MLLGLRTQCKKNTDKMATTLHYSGSTIPFSLEISVAVENVVFNFVEKKTQTVIAKFAYPALTDYSTLTKNGNIYTGVLYGIDTENINSGMLTVDVKTFVNGTYAPIGTADVQSIISTTVAKVKKW